MKEITIKEIEELLGYKIKIVADKPGRKLADVPISETFKVGDLEFIVLEHYEDSTYVILKDFWKTTKFDDDTSNYANSSIRKDLNSEFYNKIASIVDKDNIVSNRVDLTSDDGRKDYGYVIDFVSLLTCNLYRKYVAVLDKYNPKKLWWLATSYSTKSNGHGFSVRCVDGDGALDRINCRNRIGVRPFCIFKSSIFIS